uniref:Uncharacterized protein n=1 Tax=Romanomermis culicivorax TaxID=13658 RepID=A0A915HZ94_ROMCU
MQWIDSKEEQKSILDKHFPPSFPRVPGEYAIRQENRHVQQCDHATADPQRYLSAQIADEMQNVACRHGLKPGVGPRVQRRGRRVHFITPCVALNVTPGAARRHGVDHVLILGDVWYDAIESLMATLFSNFKIIEIDFLILIVVVILAIVEMFIMAKLVHSAVNEKPDPSVWSNT